MGPSLEPCPYGYDLDTRARHRLWASAFCYCVLMLRPHTFTPGLQPCTPTPGLTPKKTRTSTLGAPSPAAPQIPHKPTFYTCAGAGIGRALCRVLLLLCLHTPTPNIPHIHTCAGAGIGRGPATSSSPPPPAAPFVRNCPLMRGNSFDNLRRSDQRVR